MSVIESPKLQGLGPMSVAADSEFAMNLWMTIAKHHPQRIIETGTYLGTGTTAVIASAVDDMIENGVYTADNVIFVTIEANSEYADVAEGNLKESGFDAFTKVLRGLTIPREIIPTPEAIKEWTVDAVRDLPIQADHHESDRVYRYYSETAQDGPDDLMGQTLERFGGCPDFVLLDSAGHLGLAEFEYLIDNLKGPCFISCDDIFHVKHYRSFQMMSADSRFDIRCIGREKFGYCIARFEP